MFHSMSELVTCPHCGQRFKSLTSRHKAICAGWPKGPEVPPCLCGHVATSMTQMKRHRTDCEVWKSRDSKEVRNARRSQTNLYRYGVERVAQLAEVREKTAATNLERYGAASVSSRDSIIFEKIQDSLQGRRFRFAKGSARNPFAQREIRERIRQTRLERHGVEHPAQLPDHREKARQTSLDRYGTEHPMQSLELQARRTQTNVERYGHENAAASEEVKSKIRVTNLERYGVSSTAAVPEFRRKQLATHQENWGDHFFASSQGKHKIRAGMRAKHGVDHPSQVEGYWKRQVQQFIEKYGVSHPLQLAEFLEKRSATCRRLYGSDNPLRVPPSMEELAQGLKPGIASIWERNIRTCLAKVGKLFPEFERPATCREDLIERYGIDAPMRDREYAAFHLTQMGEAFKQGPNGFEAKILRLCGDRLLYTGNRKFWRWLPALGHHKNPDFIVPGPDPKQPFRGVTRVVEAHGNFWHSERFTGMSNEEHERLLVDAYAEVGIECLVVWEHELKGDPETVRRRAMAFVVGAVPQQISLEETQAAPSEVALWD